jgi:uncharacterized protein YutE (UPF0331/DUF86 family)
MMDVVLNKKESIERCIQQVRYYYGRPSDLPFAEDHFKQDAIAVNLQRMAEQAIALANHVVKKKKLGLPKDSRESFELLARAGAIPAPLAKKLQGMVGFRNVLVHEYRELDLKIMADVIENRMDDLIEFTNLVMDYVNAPSS